MADNSYLFGNTPPASMTSTLADSSSALPAWLQEMTRGLGSKATSVAGGEYTPYQAPTGAPTYGEQSGQLAGFNADQNAAFQATRNLPNTYAGNLAYANQTVPQATQSYMNPYVQNVVDQIPQLGQRNLTENLLPQVNSTFTGQGQFGSTRNADFTNRALRDTNESILRQQTDALSAGYKQAQDMSLEDLKRQGALAQTTQQLNAADIGLLSTAGQQQQGQTQANLDTGRKDWQAQQDWQKQNIDWLSQIIRGLPASETKYQYQSAAPQQSATMSPLAAAAQGFFGTRSVTSPTTTTNR